MPGAASTLQIPQVLTVANSGTATRTFTVDRPGTGHVDIVIAAAYAATVATGLGYVIQTSPDNSTFTNFLALATIAPAFGSQLSPVVSVPVDGPGVAPGGPINYVRVNLTNGESSNAATVAITAQNTRFA